MDSVDFKGYYSGSIVDQPPDPVLYRRVAEAFPDAWIEDPALTEETDAVLAPTASRFSWDAPIHSIEDIQSLPYPPKMVNIKPSRLGGLSNLLDAYAYCAGARDRQLRGRTVRARRGTRDRTSTWPRCSTPTPPTTSPPRATTCRAPGRPAGSPLARRPRGPLGLRLGPGTACRDGVRLGRIKPLHPAQLARPG